MYLTLVGIVVIAVIFLGLLFLFTPWLYRPYLNLLDAREALEAQTDVTMGAEAVERLEQSVEAEWQEARTTLLAEVADLRGETRQTAQKEVDEAKVALQERAAAEEAELGEALDRVRTDLSDHVTRLSDELVDMAIGRNA
jgi:F0F1-type ATP synthase membrane subunit b/b'